MLTTDIGTVDNSAVDVCTTVHLSGVLPTIRVDMKVQKIGAGSIEFSGAVLPWVGEAPPDISGCRQGVGKELVALAYIGDGMCAAWGAAEEVVARILVMEGRVEIIEEIDVTVERVEKAKSLKGLVGMFFG